MCSSCHPFYTGKQKIVDTGGRVDKFRKQIRMSVRRYNPPMPCSASFSSRNFVVPAPTSLAAVLCYARAANYSAAFEKQNDDQGRISPDEPRGTEMELAGPFRNGWSRCHRRRQALP